MTKTVWILTRELNQYNQDGEYFVEAYTSKPTWQQLEQAGVPQNRWEHVQNGGGWKKGDYHEWFHLVEVELK